MDEEMRRGPRLRHEVSPEGQKTLDMRRLRRLLARGSLDDVVRVSTIR
jgi:hypothetical protein